MGLCITRKVKNRTIKENNKFKDGEDSIVINNTILIKVIGVKNNKAIIDIEAPEEYNITRLEKLLEGAIYE